MPTQDHTTISSIQGWNALIRARRVPTGVTLVGELEGDGAGTALLMPIEPGDQARFASVPVRLSKREHKLVASGTSSRGRRATVRGTLDCDDEGRLAVARVALLQVDEGAPGPFTHWLHAQARQVGVDPEHEVTRASPQDIVAHLRQQVTDSIGGGLEPHKRIVWLGRQTQAFWDAVGSGAGTLESALDIGGAAMQGPNAVEEMCAALAAVDPARVSLVIISRGGGDRAELAVFDDARLLRAVQKCPVRTVCAVGHQRNRPLLEAVCDWALASPTSLRGVLVPVARGLPTAREERADARQRSRGESAARDRERVTHRQEIERHRREMDRAQATIAQLQRERDEAREWASRAFGHTDASRAQRLIDVRDDNARRIRQRYRQLAWSMALICPAVAWIWALAAPVQWRAGWDEPLSTLAIGWAMALVVWLAPRRLGRRPWFRRGRPTAPEVSFRAANTVGAFNRADARWRGITPKLRR